MHHAFSKGQNNPIWQIILVLKGCIMHCIHYGAAAASQGHGDTPNPSESPWYVSLNDGWRPLKQWIVLLTASHTHTPVQAGPTDSSELGGSEAGFGILYRA